MSHPYLGHGSFFMSSLMQLDKHFTEAYLFDALKAQMTQEGFQLKEGLKQFRKSEEKGFQSLIVAVSPYEDLVLVEFHFGIRLHAIEDLVGRFTRSLPGWKADAHTLILSQGKLFKKPYWRFEAKDTEDLDGILRDFNEMWQKQAQAFLRDHFSVKQVDHLLNAFPEQPSPYLPNQAHRCLRALAAASLSQNQELEKLIRLYRSGLQKIPGGKLYMEGFDKLAGYLRGISWN